MMKRWTLVLVCCLLAVATRGLESRQPELDTWSSRAGMGATIGVGDFYDGSTDMWSEFGMLLALGREFRMREGIYLEPGLGLIRNGTGVDYYYEWYDIFVTYLYLPVLANIKLEIAPNAYFTLSTGPALKFRVGASGYWENDYGDGELSDDFFDDLNGVVFATELILGLEFPLSDKTWLGPQLWAETDLTDTWDADYGSSFLSGCIDDCPLRNVVVRITSVLTGSVRWSGAIPNGRMKQATAVPAWSAALLSARPCILRKLWITTAAQRRKLTWGQRTASHCWRSLRSMQTLICSGELGQYPLQGLIEIEDEQIDPRSQMVGVLPNDPGNIRIVGALIVDQNEE
jgi:hypothetical protein